MKEKIAISKDYKTLAQYIYIALMRGDSLEEIERELMYAQFNYEI